MSSYIDVKFTKPVTLKPGITLSQLNGLFLITNSTTESAISHNSATIINDKVRLNLNIPLERPLPMQQISITYTPTEGKGLVDSSTPHALVNLSHSIKTITSDTQTTPAWGTTPTITITSEHGSNGGTNSHQTIDVKFTVNTETDNFILSDVATYSGGIVQDPSLLSNWSGPNDNVYDASFTPILNTVCKISVGNDVFTATSRPYNYNTGHTFDWTHKSAPVMTITSTEVNDGDTSNDATLSLIFTSTESTLNFAVGDITTVGGSLGPLSGNGTGTGGLVDATIFTATFTTTVDGAKTIDVAASTFTDSLFNINNTASVQFNWIRDTTAPVFGALFPATGSSVNTSKVGYTLSEAISSGTVKYTRTGGTASADFECQLSGTELSSGAFGPATLTNAPNLVGGTTYTIDFNGTDSFGNSADEKSVTGIIFDSTDPGMVISSTMATGSSSADPSILLTFTSSEITTDFSIGDITKSGGGLSSFTGSGKIYTTIFTPSAIGVQYSIHVDVNAFQDAVGNSNTISNTFTWTQKEFPIYTLELDSSELDLNGTGTRVWHDNLGLPDTYGNYPFYYFIPPLKTNNGTVYTDYVDEPFILKIKVSDTNWVFSPDSSMGNGATNFMLYGLYPDSNFGSVNSTTQPYWTNHVNQINNIRAVYFDDSMTGNGSPNFTNGLTNYFSAGNNGLMFLRTGGDNCRVIRLPKDLNPSNQLFPPSGNTYLFHEERSSTSKFLFYGSRITVATAGSTSRTNWDGEYWGENREDISGNMKDFTINQLANAVTLLNLPYNAVSATITNAEDEIPPFSLNYPLSTLENNMGDINYTLDKPFSTGSIEFLPETGSSDVKGTTNASTNYTITLTSSQLSTGQHTLVSRPIIPNISYGLKITLDTDVYNYTDISFNGFGGYFTGRMKPPLSYNGCWLEMVHYDGTGSTVWMGPSGNTFGTKLTFQFTTWLPNGSIANSSTSPVLLLNQHNGYYPSNLAPWEFSVNGGSWQSLTGTGGTAFGYTSGGYPGGTWYFAWPDASPTVGHPFSVGDTVVVKYTKPLSDNYTTSLAVANGASDYSTIKYTQTQQTLPIEVTGP